MKKLLVLLLTLISIPIFAELRGNITGICYQINENTNIWSNWQEYNAVIQFSDSKVNIIDDEGSYYFPVFSSNEDQNGNLILYCYDKNNRIIRFRFRLYNGILQVYVYPYNSKTILYQVEDLIEI